MDFIYGLIVGLLILPAIAVATGLREWLKRWSVARKQRALDEAFPTWRNTVRSRKFEEWFCVQPTDTRKLGASWKPGDAIEVLRRFEQR